MRILRSGRCRIALALLLTFAAWVASCWWMMPYRPRTTFRITDAGSAPDPEKEYPVDGREYRQLLDISPSGDTIYFNCWAYKARQHSTWNEYWDTKAGKRTEQNSAEELFRFGVCHREPSPYRWDTRLGVSYQQAVASYRYQVSLNLWECDGWRGYDHAFSDNGRFLASPVWAGRRRCRRRQCVQSATHLPT